MSHLAGYSCTRSVIGRASALAAMAVAMLAFGSSPARAGTSKLRVGVGRADITPITGGFKGGWSCTCAKVIGQQERLYARVIVVDEGGRKMALVTEDLFALSAGMVRDAAALLPRLGFSEQNIIDGATHDHSSQSGYMNQSGDNLILPSNSNPTLSGITATSANPVLYSFMTRQLALAIRRANNDLRPGAVGWGQTRLLGVTENRSLGAHLADFGLSEGPNGGNASQDPGGYPDTIDPAVNVLRVDQFRRVRKSVRLRRHGRVVRHHGHPVRRRRIVTERMPVGIFSTFANHGTVDHENFWYLSGDHQGAAERVVEAAIRADGHVPASQSVVNAFANSDAGDMTSGIQYSGPADAEYVGRREAAAMLTAWRRAGHAMSTHPALGLRWTRECFCGQETSGGPIDSTPWVGKAAGAGSEEGRTIFYYDGLAHEGDKLPFDVGPQGDKITVLDAAGSVPKAVPFTVARIGDGLIATIPGEPTVGVGKMIRDALGSAVSGSGISHVVLEGYSGDYLNYFTTPDEYEQQAYEGGFTMYGHYSSLVLESTLVDLAKRLVSGQPSPAPYQFDPNNGVHVTDAGYGDGAAAGSATAQPGAVMRLGHASFSWNGGANGVDRPVDAPFVTIERLARSRHRTARHRGGVQHRRRRTAPARWVRATNDLGMQIEWSSDADGHYRAQWEVPLTATPGTYRFEITAKRYKLTSARFKVRAGAILTPKVSGGKVSLAYPQPFLLNDWTYRPLDASGGRITYLVRRRRVTVRRKSSTAFRIPGGASVTIPARGARDRYGNTNRAAIRVR
jgi:neutral ceramidase